MRKKDFYINSKCADVFFKTGKEGQHFYGYYGISPWNVAGDKLLSHRLDSQNEYLTENDIVDIGFFDFEGSGQYQKVSQTTACNWQQGSMLQWLPASNDKIIFNVRSRDGFSAEIWSLADKRVVRDIKVPVSEIDPTGRFAFILPVARLSHTRKSYSYAGEFPSRWKEGVVKEDGLKIVSLSSGEQEMVVSTEMLAEIEPTKSSLEAHHWLDHPLISPDGKKFLFYHRWLTRSGNFFTRLYSGKFGAHDLHLYPDSGMYSHAAWLDSDSFVVFGRKPGSDPRERTGNAIKEMLLKGAIKGYSLVRNHSILKKLRKRILQDRYFVFRVGSDVPEKVLSGPYMTEDGHPSFCPADNNLMVTDTYPDSKGYRHLLLVNLKSSDVTRIASFRAPQHHTESSPDRCDLHPRWDPSGRFISVDSMHEGKRQQYVLRLNNR